MSARILIADDLPTGRIQWRVRLAAAHYHVNLLDDPAALPAAASRERPDLIVLVHRGLPDALKICDALRGQVESAEIPIILAGPDAGPEARLAALAAGAADLLETPFSDSVCLARIRSLLRARDARAELLRRQSTAQEFGFCDAGAMFQRRGRVALVARSRTLATDWRDTLVGTLQDRIEVLGEHAALSTADHQTSADVYVIDIGADRTEEGLQLLADLRARAETRRASVITVLQPGDAASAARALDLGASDLIPGDFEPAELALRVKAQIKRKLEADALTLAVEDGMRLAATDSLTGLYNRRYAMSHATRILREAAAADRPVAVLIGDLDHFKRVNDTYGHGAGDTVLVEIAQRLRANLRGADVLARLGGEEFLIVMPETDAGQAGPVASRICRFVAERPVVVDEGRKSVGVTMSLGVAATDPAAPVPETLEALIERADKALYAAKAAGRNQITVAEAA
ncbi:MAG: diguanylate cyclase [Paracoccaceae bacterium]|nr:diguanylate cyclase [Paracoccaceae bacterium]